MLANGVTYGVMAATLIAVAVYAITVSRHMDVTSVKNFVSARNSTSTLRLAWCFFSAGIGAGSLFAFPEIGVDAGSWGVIGYTLSGITGMAVLAIVGPYIRSVVGENATMTDVVSRRFGYAMRLYIDFISMFYQFICLASEYTCIAQLTTMMSPNAHPIITILLVAFLTNLYLTIGGLRASLATDVWQGIGVVALVALVCIAMFFHVSIPDGEWSRTNVAAFTTAGFETLVTLVIAVTASNLFFTGFWQRVYAAYDDRTLHKAAFLASIILSVFTVALAMDGMVSYLAYPDGDLFFAILIDMGCGWQVVIIIVIAMLSSGVSDSLQVGIAAELTSCFPKLTLLQARVFCVLLNAPAIAIGYQQYNILTLPDRRSAVYNCCGSHAAWNVEACDSCGCDGRQRRWLPHCLHLWRDRPGQVRRWLQLVRAAGGSLLAEQHDHLHRDTHHSAVTVGVSLMAPESKEDDAYLLEQSPV